mmetsp:Transcript_13299/g.21818  ORF Transcript_13299/g.21818 Transcript_13299/m.21818 type:complete len:358 (-) Transcript_13299:103-1176(-)
MLAFLRATFLWEVRTHRSRRIDSLSCGWARLTVRGVASCRKKTPSHFPRPPISFAMSTDGELVKLLELNGNKANYINIPGSSPGMREVREFSPSFLFFLIPGNPGVVTYYTKFLKELHSLYNGRHRVVGVGHLGHDNNGGLYSLEDQILHKLDVFDMLESEVKPETKIILIGHSVGAYVTLEMVRRRPNSRILHTAAVFPMFRNFGDCAPPFLKLLLSTGLRHVVPVAAWALSFLPDKVTGRILQSLPDLSEEARTITSLHVVNYSCVSNILHMTVSEWSTVKEWDIEFLRKHSDAVTYLYTKDDHWAPLQYYEDLKAVLPNGRVHLDTRFPHAFPLGYAILMAQKIKELLIDVVPE